MISRKFYAKPSQHAKPASSAGFGSRFQRSDSPRGTCTATRPSQASPKWAQDRPAPAQDQEAFKTDMTCCQTCFIFSLCNNLPPSANWEARLRRPCSGGQGESTQNVASLHENPGINRINQTPQSLWAKWKVWDGGLIEV